MGETGCGQMAPREGVGALDTPPPPQCCIVAPQVWGTHAMTWWKSERSFCVACRYSTVLACLLSSPSQAMLPACKDAKGG